MKKNIPITERINAGLFKQKGLKVTEPLLNVGPAGVFGRAETRDIPSPSKMKRGYSMKSSPLKKTTDPIKKKPDPTDEEVTQVNTTKKVEKPNVKPGENTPDVVTKKKYVGAANDACSAEYIKKNGKAACTKYNALSKKEKDAANTTTVKGKKTDDVKTCKPGFKMVDGKCEKTVTKEKKVYTRDQGDTMTAIERSNSERAGKRSNRRVKGSQRKIDKANRKSGAINPDTGKAYDKKKQRNARKLAEAKANNKMLKASSEGALAQTKSNRSIRARKTGTVNSASRVATKGQDSSKAAVTTATDKKNTGGVRAGEEDKKTNPRTKKQ